MSRRFILAGITWAALTLAGAGVLRAAPPAPKAYAIAEIHVTNPTAYKKYLAAVTPIVAQFGGRYLVRAGKIVPLEGNAPTGRFVVIEFPSLAVAQAFENSAQYRAIAPLRKKAAHTRLFLAEGGPR
jgi:uncharacterized protein (DUF1330 family)